MIVTSCEGCNSERYEYGMFCHNCGLKYLDIIPTYTVVETTIDSSLAIEYTKLINEQSQTLAEIDAYIQFENEYQTYMDDYNILIKKKEEFRILVNSEKNDILELKKVSWKKIATKIKGTHNEILSKEEAEYLDALTNYEVISKQFSQTKKTVENMKSNYSTLVKLRKKEKSFALKIEELINTAGDRIVDKEENRLEKEYEEISSKLRDMIQVKSILKSAHASANGAYHSLVQAKQELSSAGKYATWDTWVGGGLLVDMVKNSKVSDGKAALMDGRRQLNHAHRLIGNRMSEIGKSEITDLSGSNIGDVWFDNFFSDFSRKKKINKAEGSASHLRGQANTLRKKLMRKINKLDAEITLILEKEKKLKQNLINRRVQLITQISK